MKKVVEITKVRNLKKGEPNQCHYNSAIYAIENNCNFVCGWYYSSGKFPVAHCIVEKNGKYMDPTLNKGGKFKIVHTYTAEEICNIFNEVGQAFIPFIGSHKNGDYSEEYYVYNGIERVPNEKIKEWEKYIYENRFE